jgi:hypothetical protein
MNWRIRQVDYEGEAVDGMAQNGSETLLVREFRATNDEKQPESPHLTAKLAVKMVSLLKKSERERYDN